MTEKTLTIVYASRMHSTLTNALSIAAERFTENAKMFDQVAATGGNPMVTENAARELAKEFRKQAQETRLLSDYFNNLNEAVTVVADIEDEEDEE
jgi:predicted ATP-dependent protease